MKQTDAQNFYMEFQFFNDACRSTIYNYRNSNIVHNYEINNKYLEKSEYVITVGSTIYRLKIDNIHLKVFNTGVAIFYIDCSNQDVNQFSVEAIKNINEYGRRISLSFWPDEGGYKKCADKIEITEIGTKDHERMFFYDDFKAFVLQAEQDKNSYISLTYLSKMIRGLLNLNIKHIKFRSKEEGGMDEIAIKPILDGKMFVSCLIVDHLFMDCLSNEFKEEDNSFGRDVEKDLLELIEVDLPGECSLGNANDRSQYLKETLYVSNFAKNQPGGKLLAITQQSCMKLVPQNDYEVAYHLNIYNQLIILGIVQRVTIVNFQQQVAAISYGIENPKKKMSNKLIFQIMDLQERYVAFQNQILLFEVSPQKEGKYIYQKIRQALAVSEENEALSATLSGIYELANIK